MITTAVTAAIVSALSIAGVQPTPWLIGAIWVAVKALIVLGAFGAISRLFQKGKAPAVDA